MQKITHKVNVAMTPRKVPLAEARANLQKAWELYNSHMPLEHWARTVRPDVAAWAVKVHGSLEQAHNESMIWVCELVLLTYKQWQGAEARHQSRKTVAKPS
jgi:hypothetical protein